VGANRFVLTKAAPKIKASESEWSNFHKCSYTFTKEEWLQMCKSKKFLPQYGTGLMYRVFFPPLLDR
jgi:hypothetical protein